MKKRSQQKTQSFSTPFCNNLGSGASAIFTWPNPPSYLFQYNLPKNKNAPYHQEVARYLFVETGNGARKFLFIVTDIILTKREDLVFRIFQFFKSVQFSCPSTETGKKRQWQKKKKKAITNTRKIVNYKLKFPDFSLTVQFLFQFSVSFSRLIPTF